MEYKLEILKQHIEEVLERMDANQAGYDEVYNALEEVRRAILLCRDDYVYMG